MKKNLQPQLPLEIPSGDAAAPEVEIAEVDLIDDAPDVITSDLRKFNRTRVVVAAAIKPLKLILKISDAAGVSSAMEHMKAASKVEKAIEKKRQELVRPYNDEVSRINTHARTLSEDLPKELNRVKGLVLLYDQEQKAEAKRKRTEARDKYLLDIAFVRYPSGRDKLAIDHYFDDITAYLIYRRDLEEVSDEVWEIMMRRVGERRDEERERSLGQLQQEKAGHEFFGDDDAAAAVDTKISEVKTAPKTTYLPNLDYSAPKTQGLTKRWKFEVTDVAQVPREYLAVDESKVKAAITAGTRTIPGIRIYQDESITLR